MVLWLSSILIKKSLKNMNSECFKDKYKLIDWWMLWLRNMEQQEQSKKEMLQFSWITEGSSKKAYCQEKRKSTFTLQQGRNHHDVPRGMPVKAAPCGCFILRTVLPRWGSLARRRYAIHWSRRVKKWFRWRRCDRRRCGWRWSDFRRLA